MSVECPKRAARTVGKLIASNVRKRGVADYSDYRGIYCVECDFHYGMFPRGADFTGAVLDRSNFSGARLQEAVFDNAELAGTKFVEADLRGAKFRSLDQVLPNAGDADDKRVLTSRTTYLDHIASALDLNATVDITMPNFSCANLANANFDHHSLFPGIIVLTRPYTKDDKDKPGWYQNVPGFIKDVVKTQPTFDVPIARISPPKFYKANIAGAHFENVRFFTFNAKEFSSNFFYLTDSHGTTVGDITVDLGDMSTEAFEPGIADDPWYRAVYTFQRRLRAAFFLVDIDHALFSRRVADFLRRDVPRVNDFLSVFRLPFGQAFEDPDTKCVPRDG